MTTLPRKYIQNSTNSISFGLKRGPLHFYGLAMHGHHFWSSNLLWVMAAQWKLWISFLSAIYKQPTMKYVVNQSYCWIQTDCVAQVGIVVASECTINV